MDPHKSVVFGYDGVPAHLDLAIPAQYEHSLCDIDIVEKDLSCLKATPKADISSPEIKRCITGMRASPSNLTSGVRKQQLPCLKLRAEDNIATAAKCANGYYFMETYLPKCLNSEVFEGYSFNGLKFRPNLFEFLLFN